LPAVERRAIFSVAAQQALRRWRKPLVVFTPKSMLRHPDASSPMRIFSARGSSGLFPIAKSLPPKRILVCSGKIGHEAAPTNAKQRSENETAILFLDQLYPFPKEELRAENCAPSECA